MTTTTATTSDAEHDEDDRRQPADVGQVALRAADRGRTRRTATTKSTIWTTNPETESMTPAVIAVAGVHAEALEEAHVDGDPGRRARDRQVDVADGELQRGERSERQRVLERAHRADRRRHPWDLGQDEGERQPPPPGVAQCVDERLEVHVAERADERVGGDAEQRQVEQRADRDPAQLDELLLAAPERRRARGCGRRRARRRCRRARRGRRPAGPPPAGTAAWRARRRRRAPAGPRRRPAPRRRRRWPRASAWASSLAAIGGRLGDDADDRSPNPTEPSSRWTTRSRSSRWWAMPASCRLSRSPTEPSSARRIAGSTRARSERPAVRAARRRARRPARRCRP